MKVFPRDRDLNLPPEEVELRVEARDLQLPIERVELRLDQFLQRALKWRSRTSIQDLIRGGSVSVDPVAPERPEGSGTLAVERRPGRRLRHGSRVVIAIPEASRLPRARASAEDLAILYEDERVVAVDKPPMVVVHPAGRHLTDTLIQQIYRLYPVPSGERAARPRLCHRLDRETSGLVLVGKDPEAHSAVMGQFENRLVEKEYLAIVRGNPRLEGGLVDHDLGSARGAAIGLQMAVVPAGLPSRTEWSVLERRRDCALLACRPLTGRQHQIRVHMDAIGHPLVGDKLYGAPEGAFERGMRNELTERDLAELGLPRHALHNHRLVFTTPDGDRRVEVKSPLAEDLRDWLDEQPPAEG